MAAAQRTDASLDNASDSVHAYEALAIVKKLGLSLRQDQEIVINMCTEIATYKQTIKKMEKSLEAKEQEINALKTKMKDKNLTIEGNQKENGGHLDVSTQYERSQTTSETQTDQIEKGQSEEEENEQALTEEEAHKTHTDTKGEVQMQDASTQIKICFANIATQIEPGKMIDASVQTEKKSKNIIVKNIDDISTTDVTKWAVDMHAIGNIPDEHNATKHSSGHHHGNLRLSISTQTDISEKGYYSNDSIDAINSLPPITTNSTRPLLKSRYSESSRPSRYHRHCLPQKHRGKTWIF